MEFGQAKRLLGLLTKPLDDVRLVFPVDPEQAGEVIAHIRSLGYAAMVQSSAFADAEIVVTENVENEDA